MSNLNLDPIYTAQCSLDAFTKAFTPNLDYKSTRANLKHSIELEKLAVSLNYELKQILFIHKDMFVLYGVCTGQEYYRDVQNLYDYLLENYDKPKAEAEDIPF